MMYAANNTVVPSVKVLDKCLEQVSFNKIISILLFHLLYL